MILQQFIVFQEFLQAWFLHSGIVVFSQVCIQENINMREVEAEGRRDVSLQVLGKLYYSC